MGCHVPGRGLPVRKLIFSQGAAETRGTELRPAGSGPGEPGRSWRGAATAASAPAGKPPPHREGPSAKQLGLAGRSIRLPGMSFFSLGFWCAVVLTQRQLRSSKGGGGRGGREGPSPLYCEI